MLQYLLMSLPFLAVSIFGFGCHSLQELPRGVAREFLPDSAQQYVEFLASDELQGRGTPSPGLLRAAVYIADAFRRWGLQPLGKNYWHEYELVRRDLCRDSLRLRIWRGGTPWEAAIPEQAVPHAITGAGRYERAPLLFLGGEEVDTSEFRALSSRLQGAVVVLTTYRQERRGADTTRKQTAPSRLSLRERVRLLHRYGVVGVLLSEYPEPGRSLRPQRFPWPVLSSLSVQVLPWQLAQSDTDMPVVYSIGEDAIAAIFGSVDAFRERVYRADTVKSLVIESLPGVFADGALAFEVKERTSVPNVVGIIRGRRHPEQYVLIGAHYDHVGVIAAPNSRDSIYNGADDNASGTAGLLLIARALGQWRRPPERSIVLVAFSGEEKGLIGSQAFVKSSPLPLQNCLAMLNLDMIGRNHPDSLSIGVREEWLRKLVEQENQRLKSPFLLGREAEEFFGRSDHAVFAARGIPAVFFFTGLHEDYHRPSDHADKINYDKLSRVALLAARVAWQIAQQGKELMVP